jgi:hypothetical protein
MLPSAPVPAALPSPALLSIHNYYSSTQSTCPFTLSSSTINGSTLLGTASSVVYIGTTTGSTISGVSSFNNTLAGQATALLYLAYSSALTVSGLTSWGDQARAVPEPRHAWPHPSREIAMLFSC